MGLKEVFLNYLELGNRCWLKLLFMLGGLNEITALELFTQNYLIWGRICFAIWKRIEFYVYPPGARLSRPPHRYAQGPYFFCEIAGLTRVWPGSNPQSFWRKNVRVRPGSDPGQTRVGPGFWKTPLSSLEAPGLIYSYSAPGGWHCILKRHRTKKSRKLCFIFFDVQNHFSKTLIKYAQNAKIILHIEGDET